MKKKLFLTSLVLTAALSISTAFAAEDIIYYDNTDLDSVFDDHPDFDREKYRSKDFVPKNKEKDQETPSKPKENVDESTREDVYYRHKDGTLAKGLTDTGEVRRYFDKETGQLVKNKKFENENIYVDKNGEAHHIGWDYYNGKLGYYNPETGYAKGLKKIELLF